jgi:hypothetical protein
MEQKETLEETPQGNPTEEEKKEEVKGSPENNSDNSPAQEHSGSGSIEKLSRSKLQYEADPEELELREKLLESKLARKRTEEDSKVLLNRLQLLKNEEQKVSKFLLSFRHGKK